MELKETGTQIRVPATANFMLDSFDEPNQNPFNLLVTRNQSLLNGFFNRIATSEVVLEWTISNIYEGLGNAYLQWSVGATDYSGNIVGGAYTMARLVDTIADFMTAETPGSTFTITQLEPGLVSLDINAGTFQITGGGLANLLNLVMVAPAGSTEIENHDIRPFRYLDFVSQQLTYNQDLQDSATNIYPQNVLCRWYLAYDQPPEFDTYGYPILMGYSPFYLRRLFNPPKQIKWNPSQPIGQLAFVIWGMRQNGEYIQLSQLDLDGLAGTNWLMTLQVSEN